MRQNVAFDVAAIRALELMAGTSISFKLRKTSKDSIIDQRLPRLGRFLSYFLGLFIRPWVIPPDIRALLCPIRM